MADIERRADDRRSTRRKDLPESIWDVRGQLDENFRRVEALLRDMEAEQDSRMRLAVAAELRHHLALAEKTLESAARADAVHAFEQIVINALAEASAAVRRKVVEKMRARSSHGRNNPSAERADGEDRSAIRAGADG